MGFTGPTFDRFVTSLHLWALSRESVGPNLRGFGVTAPASTAWPANDLAIYVPLTIQRTVTLIQAFVSNGATVSGNFDVGLFGASGTKLVSTGSTAQAGVSTIQTVNTTDYIATPGRYYLGLSVSTTVATVIAHGSGTAVVGAALGLAQEALVGVALPTTATFAQFAQTMIPHFGFSWAAVI